VKILGLDICANTLVGDNMHRGISGGQKKRVTTGTKAPPYFEPISRPFFQRNQSPPLMQQPDINATRRVLLY
jgi:hypothetical protein